MIAPASCPAGHSGDVSDGTGQGSVEVLSRLSESSDDSFHSTVESIEDVDISVSYTSASFPYSKGFVSKAG